MFIFFPRTLPNVSWYIQSPNKNFSWKYHIVVVVFPSILLSQKTHFSWLTKRVVHMRAHAQKRTISGGCTQAGSPVSSSSGPKIMVVISCTVGKGISTGWMDAIFPFCKNTPGNIGMCYVRFCAWKEVLKHQIFHNFFWNGFFVAVDDRKPILETKLENKFLSFRVGKYLCEVKKNEPIKVDLKLKRLFR